MAVEPGGGTLFSALIHAKCVNVVSKKDFILALNALNFHAKKYSSNWTLIRKRKATSKSLKDNKRFNSERKKPRPVKRDIMP